jgi:hypothetical protein
MNRDTYAVAAGNRIYHFSLSEFEARSMHRELSGALLGVKMFKEVS